MSRVLHSVRRLAAGAVLFAALVRLLSAHSRFPWWEVDPTRAFVPETTLRPSHGLVLDVVVWIAAALGVGACVLLGERLRWRTGLLALTGALWALAIGGFRVRAGAAPDDLSLGSAWASAMIGAWSVTHLARDRGVRIGLIAVIAGAAWTLAFKGGYQVFVEHPATVAHFRANPDAALTAQGIEPGSSGAREFERRLMQPEATGWVGLSNAHASVMGVCLVLCSGLAVAGVRAARARCVAGGVAGVPVLAAGVAAAGLVMTGSKGGVMAALVGITIAIAALVPTSGSTRRSPAPEPGGSTEPTARNESLRPELPPASVGALHPPARAWGSWPWIALAIPLLALAAVVTRGFVGERWDERSLLFRSQYLAASLPIMAEAFPSGVGPGGFKAAYALHKPPLSPETVESPHSICFDWIACLGLAGAAWCGLLPVWTARMGRVARHAVLIGDPTIETPRSTTRGSPPSLWVWLVVPIVACATAWSREAPTVALDEYPIRAIGVLAWVATVWCALRITQGRSLAAALFGAGVALVTHAQIEVTAVLPATAPVALLLIALAGTDPLVEPEPAAQPGVRPRTNGARNRSFGLRRLVRVASLALLVVVPAFWIAPGLARVSRWEASLRAAAEAARPIAETRAAMVAGQADPAAAAVSLRSASDAAARHLHEASEARPESLRADEACARLLVGVAVDLVSLRQADDARAAIARAAAHLARVESRDGGARAPLFAATAAGAYHALASLDPNPLWLERAAARWRVVIDRDPTALSPVLRLIDALVASGDPRSEEVRALARRALTLDANLRLDPLKRMPAPVRARIEALAQGPEGQTRRSGEG